MTTSCERTNSLRAEGIYQIEDRQMGLALDEAICPCCNLAFFVGERAFSWGACPDCIGVALVPVE